MALTPISEALQHLLEGVLPLPGESVPLAQAMERVLAEPIVALRTQPPFDASAMDGYAVRNSDIEALPARLRVIGTAPAGRGFTGQVGRGETVRIFTGAPLPEAADTIVIQENVRDLGDGMVEVLEPASRGANIRRSGLDFSKGDLLLEQGRLLDPSALALAASANHPVVHVVRRPIVAIIATGDELLTPGSEPGPNQIISSNAYGVAGVAHSVGARALDLGIAPDRKEAIAQRIRQAVEAKVDVLITLGGASVGDLDLVHEALTGEGMVLDFWKIAMRPGKPLMSGRLGNIRCIGLPGNPVASLVCSHLFLKPLLARLGGRMLPSNLREARLGAAMAANDHRQDYVRATVADESGTLVATPFGTQDSSMLRRMADAHGLIVREPFAPAAAEGAPCLVLMLR